MPLFDNKKVYFALLPFLLLLCCSSSLLSASTITPTYVLGLDVGPSITQPLGNQTTFTAGYSTFNYSKNPNASYPLQYGISLYKSTPINMLNTLQWGISYQRFTKMLANGIFSQGISPPYSPFTYTYSVKNAQLLAEAKWLHQWRHVYYPYFLGGIGPGFNTLKGYKTNVPDYLTVTPVYQNKTTYAFSYNLGLGIDKLIASNMTIGIGYRFSNLGHLGLGNGYIRNTNISNQLKQTSLSINALLIQLNYFWEG
ncbi:MAG: hypothetical protein K0U37_07325 [Gammaproteobacteria bacterium]|nr:hypothetical protein [Gammaproteobacteria bacterium]